LVKNKKIAGVGFGFDLTKRALQSKLKSKGLPWERAKAFKGAAVFSEFVKIDDIDDLEIKVYKNKNLVQKSDISLMIYKLDFLIKDIDKIFGLDDYDIVMSGTPKGVGEIKKDDILEGEILKKEKIIIKKSWRV